MDALNEIFDLTFEIEELQNKRHEIQEVIFHKIRSHTERLKVIALELTNNSVGDDIFLVSQKHEGWYRLDQPGERRLSDSKLTLEEYKTRLKDVILGFRIDPNHEDFREYDEGKNDLIEDIIEAIDRTPQEEDRRDKLFGRLVDLIGKENL
ncbi:hypothetical protein [Leptospira noguchii]|uniref:hypothetical protein n=1 Tax=Leptospira noguchii TaxID=28182 RepID=UPI000A7C5BFF|nr:hypothetical protein [Leptospira noguchii]UOG61470.1 hypothetical protein MAL07_05470 [Leptospira noguchii]